MSPPPASRPFDLLTLKVVSESHVTWATSVPSLVFLGLSVLDIGPMNATDVRRQTHIIAPLRGWGITIIYAVSDDTEEKLHIVLYITVIFLGTGVRL